MNTTDLIKSGQIVDILKVGLSGLVFLLALLSLRLLIQVAHSPHPNMNLLRAIRSYMIHTTILAIIVAATSLVPGFLQKQATETAVATCDASIGRMKAQSEMPNVLPADLQASIRELRSDCGSLLHSASSK